MKKELDLPVIEIEDVSAKLDGGDVLFTGREFFVGLSDKTNEAGAKAVAAAFPEYSCIPIKVGEQYRLKNLVSVAGPDLLCVAATKPAQDLIKVKEGGERERKKTIFERAFFQNQNVSARARPGSKFK